MKNKNLLLFISLLLLCGNSLKAMQINERCFPAECPQSIWVGLNRTLDEEIKRAKEMLPHIGNESSDNVQINGDSHDRRLSEQNRRSFIELSGSFNFVLWYNEYLDSFLTDHINEQNPQIQYSFISFSLALMSNEDKQKWLYAAFLKYYQSALTLIQEAEYSESINSINSINSNYLLRCNDFLAKAKHCLDGIRRLNPNTIVGEKALELGYPSLINFFCKKSYQGLLYR